MRIIINQKLVSDINVLLDDPSVKEAVGIWGFEGLHKKSAKLFLHQLDDSDTVIYTDC